jgi:hypothetical protein
MEAIMSYGTIVMDDGTEVLIEVETPELRNIRLTERGVIQDLKEQFSRVMNIAKLTAQSAHAGYNGIPEVG